jgi:hypothetical protein
MLPRIARSQAREKEVVAKPVPQRKLRFRPRFLDESLSVRQSDEMETTLTDFQRNFSAVRAAADQGETIRVKSGSSTYIFLRASEQPERPFADLESLFGVVRRVRKTPSAHETIRQRLKTRPAH